ncbi:PREDICTED: NAC domain-containing protein 83-like isoform X2 [Tarenaya hassleriana]|uniref:NAC domain-containing protein 83-like isoform X2 n=1 Tax=Tarenaya hassleriana TaxID=28532 RepID=UPI00053C5AA4|nr:PREDICTED: NAC domain-containing protein 83-like isoform X2 [Tarenaya hassleriana]
MVLKWEMKGFRFRPTDQELIKDYLDHKNLGDETPVHEAINEIIICRFDPWDLHEQSKIQSEDDKVWYFFSPRVTKYSNSKRANRKTKNGYWKVTGRDRCIKGKNQKVIGTKKTLVFYKGRVPNAARTAWVMHEYHSSVVPPDKGVYVLCKVKDKSNNDNTVSSGGGAEPSHPLPCSSEDHVTTEETSETIVLAEETPNSVCDFGGPDTDLGLWRDELDDGSSLSSMLMTNYSLSDYSLLPEYDSPTVQLEQNNEEVWGFSADDLASSREHGLNTFMHESPISFESFYQSDLINISEGEISPAQGNCLHQQALRI